MKVKVRDLSLPAVRVFSHDDSGVLHGHAETAVVDRYENRPEINRDLQIWTERPSLSFSARAGSSILTFNTFGRPLLKDYQIDLQCFR